MCIRDRLRIFDFQYGGRPRSCIFKICKFSPSARFAVISACSCKTTSRWVERLRSYCKISISNMLVVRHLGFLEYANFYLPHGLRSRSACSCKIKSRSVERLRSYCKFPILNMAAVRHLGFLKYYKTGQEVY